MKLSPGSLIKPRLRKRILFNLLLGSFLLFSYYALGGWWNSAAGFLLILFFSWLIWKSDFRTRTGLRINPRQAIRSFIAAILILALSYLLIHHLAVRNDITLKPGEWKDYFHDVFYVLNEEIVLGAIILFWLTSTRNLKPVLSCALLAVFFAIIHYVFYKWIFNDRGIIGIVTLLTLFLIGFLRNSLIILSGHIGYSWALHLGWIAVMFGSMHYYTDSGDRLSEPARFNLYLGSTEMLVLAALLASSGLFLMLRKMDRLKNRNH